MLRNVTELFSKNKDLRNNKVLKAIFVTKVDNNWVSKGVYEASNLYPPVFNEASILPYLSVEKLGKIVENVKIVCGNVGESMGEK